MEYEGEVVTYATDMRKNQTEKVQTRITFLCDKTAKWNSTKAKIHGGARAPNPKAIDVSNNIVSESILKFMEHWPGG